MKNEMAFFVRYGSRFAFVSSLRDLVDEATRRGNVDAFGFPESELGQGVPLSEHLRELSPLLLEDEAAVGFAVRRTRFVACRTWSPYFEQRHAWECLLEAQKTGYIAPSTLSSMRIDRSLPRDLLNVVRERKRWVAVCGLASCDFCQQAITDLSMDSDLSPVLLYVSPDSPKAGAHWLRDERAQIIRELDVVSLPVVLAGSGAITAGATVGFRERLAELVHSWIG